MQIAQQIGPYQIVEEIARGGMAVVFRATDMRDGKTVALKILPPYFAHNPAFVKRFLKEGTNAARLKHPNIVRIFDAGEENGHYYIVMEFIRGKTLAQILAEKGEPLEVEKVIGILEQIASGLSYAHERGVVHRDIKPSNIILAEDSGRAMIMDFGIAKQITKEETMVTAPGSTVGTPAYMSPEQVRGDAYLGPESDIYSLGVLTYRLLSGQLPYPVENTLLLMNHILHEPPRSLLEARPDIPLGIAYVVMKALAKNPAHRYPNALAFIKDLKRGRYWAPSQREYRKVLDFTKSFSPAQLTTTKTYNKPPTRGFGAIRWALILTSLAILIAMGVSYFLTPWQNWLPSKNQVAEEKAIAGAPNTIAASPTIIWSPTPSPTITPTATKTSTPIPTPTESLTTPQSTTSQTILVPYESDDAAFTMLIPIDWTMTKKNGDVIFASVDGLKRVQVRHLSNVSATHASIDVVLDELLQEAETAFQQIEVGVRTRDEINGIIRVRQPITAEVLGAIFFGETLAVQHEDEAFLILAAAPLSQKPTFQQVFEVIIGSFKLNQVRAAAASPTPEAKPTPTLIVVLKPTATPTRKPSSKPKPTSTSRVTRPSDPNLVLDFENELRWLIGDQKYGTAYGTREKAAEGQRALKIQYENLPGARNRGEHFIVLMRPQSVTIPGQPNALKAQVFGNNDNAFLNLWLRDADGEVWQFTFGQIHHTGWKTLYLPIDPEGEWPVDIVQHKRNAKLDYPLKLVGLVVDNTQTEPISGVIYVDELRLAEQEDLQIAEKSPGSSPTKPPVASKETPTTSAEEPMAPVALIGHIAYSIWNPGLKNYQIQLVNANGTNSHTYYVGATQPDFCLHPRGRMVADGTKAGLEGIMVIENGQAREVFPNTTDTLPACSPEGQRVVFESRREGGPHIWIHPDINIHDDLASTRFTFGEYPSWSSKWQIIWKGCDYWAGSGGNCGIWVVPDGWGSPLRLSSDASDTAPDVAPDGQTVVFMSHRTGTWQVYSVPAYGGELRQLTTQGDNGLPTWSPDGRDIAFVSNRDGGWGLWVMHADGSYQRKIITLEAGFGAGPIDWTRQRISWGP